MNELYSENEWNNYEPKNLWMKNTFFYYERNNYDWNNVKEIYMNEMFMNEMYSLKKSLKKLKDPSFFLTVKK